MANLQAVLKQLQSDRDALETQMDRLDSVLSVLGGLDGSTRGRRAGRRHLSPAAEGALQFSQNHLLRGWCSSPSTSFAALSCQEVSRLNSRLSNKVHAASWKPSS